MQQGRYKQDDSGIDASDESITKYDILRSGNILMYVVIVLKLAAGVVSAVINNKLVLYSLYSTVCVCYVAGVEETNYLLFCLFTVFICVISI